MIQKEIMEKYVKEILETRKYVYILPSVFVTLADDEEMIMC